MEIIPDKRKLISLVEQAHDGRICLPNFQRDFVWPHEGVADLLRSVVRGYFIGSLLLLRCDPQSPPFAPLHFRGAEPKLKHAQPELLVLDGQQRLTALLYALTAPKDVALKDTRQRHWYFLNLDLAAELQDSDEIVTDLAERELNGLLSPDEQYRRRILPCTALLSQEKFYKWRDGYEDWTRANAPEDLAQFREAWRTQWTAMVGGFQSFDVPLVELPRVAETDQNAIGRVCAIFEKLNSTGVELSVYDLLTARLYRSGVNLHKLWNDACQKNGKFADWSEGKADVNKFGVLTLRTLALLRGLDPKPRNLINLNAADFELDWHRAAAAMERALELLTNTGAHGFGVFDRKWIPGFGMVPILAALRAKIENRDLGSDARSELRRWYWCNVFLERYSSAVESKSRKDYAELLNHWTADGPEPTVFAEARARLSGDGFTIRDSASYASAVYCGVFCRLAQRGAQDWKRGETIDLQKLQDHHIFPQAYLKRHGLAGRRVNSIVNRTLLSDKTNNGIKDRSPADYIGNPDLVLSDRDPRFFQPHFLSPEAVAVMENAREEMTNEDVQKVYEEFLAAREAAILGEIRSVCFGASAAVA